MEVACELYERALQQTQKAIAVLNAVLDSNIEGVTQLEVLFLHGYAHAVLKDAGGALAGLRRAVEADPEGYWGSRA